NPAVAVQMQSSRTWSDAQSRHSTSTSLRCDAERPLSGPELRPYASWKIYIEREAGSQVSRCRIQCQPISLAASVDDQSRAAQRRAGAPCRGRQDQSNSFSCSNELIRRNSWLRQVFVGMLIRFQKFEARIRELRYGTLHHILPLRPVAAHFQMEE